MDCDNPPPGRRAFRVHIRKDLLDYFDQLAEELGVDRATLLRDAIESEIPDAEAAERLLEENPLPPRAACRRKGGRS
jgi:hypothetical protein